MVTNSRFRAGMVVTLAPDFCIGSFVGPWIGSGSSKLLNRPCQPKTSKNLRWWCLIGPDSLNQEFVPNHFCHTVIILCTYRSMDVQVLELRLELVHDLGDLLQFHWVYGLWSHRICLVAPLKALFFNSDNEIRLKLDQKISHNVHETNKKLYKLAHLVCHSINFLY